MITALPSPPSTNDPSNFATKADALLAALPTFVTEANATAVAMNLNSTTDTSASSVAIGTGAKSFTVSTGKSFQPGMYLVIADVAAPSTNSMFGQITSYDVGTGALVMSILMIRGSGTKTSWVISQSSAGGAAAGPLATSGITGAAESGANSSITSLSGLTTPLSTDQGGTGSTTLRISNVFVMHTGTVTPIPDSTTNYLGPGGYHGTEVNASMVMNTSGAVVSFRAYAGNVGSGTRAYTVFKNGVATTMTASSTGGVSQAATVTNTVSFVAGDTISVRLVASGGATTSFHTVALVVYPT